MNSANAPKGHEITKPETVILYNKLLRGSTYNSIPNKELLELCNQIFGLEKEINDPVFFYFYGCALDINNKRNQAKEAFLRAIELDNKYDVFKDDLFVGHHVNYRLGGHAVEDKEYHNAKKYFKKALEYWYDPQEESHQAIKETLTRIENGNIHDDDISKMQSSPAIPRAKSSPSINWALLVTASIVLFVLAIGFFLRDTNFTGSLQNTVASHSQDNTQSLANQQAVWNPPSELWEKIYSQCGEDINCITTKMRAGKASPQAIAFTRAFFKLETTKFPMPSYLSGFWETGKVDLATVTKPVINDPNVTDFIFLVNGKPNLVENLWDHVRNIDITGDPLYFELKRNFPNLELWITIYGFHSIQHLSEGGQRFIFSFLLNDGCRACALAGTAQIAFNFDSNSRFQGTRLLRLTRWNENLRGKVINKEVELN